MTNRRPIGEHTEVNAKWLDDIAATVTDDRDFAKDPFYFYTRDIRDFIELAHRGLELPELRAEVERLRAKNTELHRRAQKAEAIADRKVEELASRGPGSFGRALANYAAYRARAKLEEVRAKLDAVRLDVDVRETIREALDEYLCCNTGRAYRAEAAREWLDALEVK